MTSPQHAIATQAGRYYQIPGYDDVQHISVTNICGIIDKPAISPWTAKLVGERAIQRETEWHAIQQERGDEDARKWISKAAKEYTDYTAQLGSAVHLACEVYDDHVNVGAEWGVSFDDWLLERLTPFAERMSEHRGTVAKNIEQIRKYVCQYARAIEEMGIEFIDRERTVCHPLYGYAGTLDAVVRIGGKTYVLDYKTGGLYPESACMQIAAYRYAILEVHGNATRARDIAIDGGAVLQLKPASYSLSFVRCDQQVFCNFIEAMRLWKWAREDSKSAVGEEWR